MLLYVLTFCWTKVCAMENKLRESGMRWLNKTQVDTNTDSKPGTAISCYSLLVELYVAGQWRWLSHRHYRGKLRNVQLYANVLSHNMSDNQASVKEYNTDVLAPSLSFYANVKFQKFVETPDQCCECAVLLFWHNMRNSFSNDGIDGRFCLKHHWDFKDDTYLYQTGCKFWRGHVNYVNWHSIKDECMHIYPKAPYGTSFTQQPLSFLQCWGVDTDFM